MGDDVCAPCEASSLLQPVAQRPVTIPGLVKPDISIRIRCSIRKQYRRGRNSCGATPLVNSDNSQAHGFETTMLIRSGHLLTSSDDDIGDALTAAYRAEGIEVIERTKIERVEVRDGKKVVHAVVDGKPQEFVADEIYNALGRSANVDGLGLELAGVKYQPFGIPVDAQMRTSNHDIYAIGDVTGEYPLVHVAIYQGEIAARNAVTGSHEQADYRIVGAHDFLRSQIGVVGATEKELVKGGVSYVRGRYDFAEHGKAMTLNKTQGFVK